MTTEQEESEGGTSFVIESSDNSDNSSSAGSIVKPPSTKILPLRTTRGKRIHDIVEESEVERDNQFWGHDTWFEEEDDIEWTTEDENHYRDKFESDFLDDTSVDSSIEEKAAAKIDKELLKKDRKIFKFDYSAIAVKRQARTEKLQRVWSVLDPRFGQPKHRFKRNLQKFLMSQAIKLAQINQSASEETQIQSETSIKPKPTAKRPSGLLETFVSWSSERKIEFEEMKKSDVQRNLEISEMPKERQVLIFTNVGDAKMSMIPPLYHQKTWQRKTWKYLEPVSRQPFNTIAEFSEIRTS